MNAEKTKRFEAAKSLAVMTLYELDMLTGDGSIIHGVGVHRHHITHRIKRLEKKGEEIVVHEHNTVFYTVCGLEQKLKEVNAWIAKVKLRGR